ncbi:MAG: AlpA family phage regulatory protein [Azonexus sp.]|nr:AlpA family phage regulatory protein [Azonexus sp.]
MSDFISEINSRVGNSYLRQAQLIPHILPFSAATLWRKVKNCTFPKPVKLSDRITAWRVSDVQEWMESRQ